MQIKTFDLALLNGGNGFSVLGTAKLGYSVSTAGDVNGDGISDLVLAAPGIASYVIFGTQNAFPASFALASLNGSNGFIIPGISVDGYLGSSVSNAGDITDDGIEDLVLGSLGANSSAGAAYVIFGTRNAFPASFNLANLNGSNGFTIPGMSALDELGFSVGSAGDINGDGIADLVLGAIHANQTGSSYVIFGRRTGFPGIFNLSTLNGSNGFSIPGTKTGDLLGVSVATAGDVNGDTISDLVLGADLVLNNSGASYVIFGTRNGFPASFNLASLNGSNGFTIPGIAAGDYLGWSVGSAGDINDDGIMDLVLGAFGSNSFNGSSYVIFGSRSGFPASFNLTSLNGGNGFIIPGIEAGGYLGRSVSGAEDINGDSITDLVLGAPEFTTGPKGVSYVIFGNRNNFPASFNLANLNGSNGFIIPGIIANGYLGNSVKMAADINGDGAADLVLGAYGSVGGGASYVIFGGFASITFTKNSLTIIEGQTVILNNTNLNSIGIISFDSLAFIVTKVQGGRFTFINASNTAIFNFTQSQIDNNQIQFISDRSNFVAYQVGMINVTNNQIIFGPIPANVNFTNYPPVVVSKPGTQIVDVGESFNFSFSASNIFNDADGDPLNYSAQLTNEGILPSWLHFDINQANALSFNGTVPTQGSTQINLTATDPLNASISTQFEIVAFPVNNTNSGNEVSTTQITGSVIGGLVGLAALAGSIFGLWRYTVNKTSRGTEQFADLIRSSLNLKDVDNFDSEIGQKYVTVIHRLQSALSTVGIDINTMRQQELLTLADDVANAARNKITPATDCLGRSVITMTDLNDNLKSLINEVQVLRASGQKFGRV